MDYRDDLPWNDEITESLFVCSGDACRSPRGHRSVIYDSEEMCVPCFRIFILGEDPADVYEQEGI